MDLTKIANEELKKDKGFIFSNNFRIVKVEDNYCELEGNITDSSLNPYGIIHGGYIFGLADTAAGIAAKTCGKSAVTLNSTIDYLKVAHSDKIKAIAKCLKSGKTISVYEVFIYDNKDNLIAKASVSYFYIDK